MVVCDEGDRVVQEFKEHFGEGTNNEAEYRALIKGLDMAASHTRTEVDCITDSELVVRQMTGSYRLRSPKMKVLFDEAKAKEQRFKTVRYIHRPRLTGRLRRCDELVNEALDEAGF